MHEKIRLLLIEDNPGDARLLEEALKESGLQFELVCRKTLSSGIELIATADFEIILLDLGLPDSQGLDTLNKLNAVKPEAPVIVLTGLRDEAAGIQAVKEGAQDYLIKGQVDSRLLVRSLHYAIERKRLLTTLERQAHVAQANAALWQTTFDTTKQLFMLLDKNYRIIKANKALRDFLGIPFNEIIGRHCFNLMHGKDQPYPDCPLARLRQSLTHEEAEIFIRERNICVSASVDPIFDDKGELFQVVHIIEDITARHRLEEQLRQAQKMQAVGQLAGGVAHDFNNLLSVILGYTDLAISSMNISPEIKDDLLEVKKASERAADLTRQLLAFSRKQILQPKPLNLNEVVISLDKMLRRTIGEDIELVLGLSPDLDLVMADPGQIEQVLVNLVVNARDAMPKGGRLYIETSRVEFDEKFAAPHEAVAPGPYIQLAVADTGCGMDEQTRARVFEPFFTTKETGKGTGLGLSTAYGIVKQSNGYIFVDSGPGNGSCFRIIFPSQPAITARAPEAVAAAAAPAHGTETILVIEDDEGMRRLASKILEEAGYTVLAAADIDEALLLNKYYHREIDLLLTDVVMPKASGREVAEQVVETRPGAKVLYMSGYTDNTIVHHGVLEPGTYFIAKPFKAADLLRKVREVLDGR